MHIYYYTLVIYCNFTFKKVNLRNNAREINLPEGDEEDNRESDLIVTLKTIVDLYGRRRNKNHWLNEYQWQEFMSLEEISGDFNLDKFANTYFVGSRGGHRNKLKLIQKKIVINFTPSLSNKPTSQMYPEYCKLSLVCYKLWVGDYPY